MSDNSARAMAPGLALDSEGVSELGQLVNSGGFETRLRKIVQDFDRLVFQYLPTIDHATPEQHTANCGNGVIDATAALNAMAGKYARFAKGGVYRITAPLIHNATNQWVFEENAYIDDSALAVAAIGLTIQGSQASPLVFSSDGLKGAFSVSFLSVAGLSRGMRGRLTSDTKFDPGRLNLNIGDQNTIVDISGNVVTFLEPFAYDYLTTANATSRMQISWSSPGQPIKRFLSRRLQAGTAHRCASSLFYGRETEQ